MAVTGKDINKAKQLLEEGEVVAIPTETVYGLAANALNATAVTKIFTVKNRPVFDPLIVHVQDLERAAPHVVSIPSQARALAEAFWPGPLTLLLERKPVIPDLVTAGLPTVGIRSPRHPLAQQLLKDLAFPLAAPSANPFGYISPTTPAHVKDQLGGRIPYILDGGPCEVGIESTIVGFSNGRGIVYRTGGLRTEDIERVIGEVDLRTSSSSPQAPGQLQSHYAPRKRMVVGNIEQLLQRHQAERCAVLSFCRDYAAPVQYVLSRSGDTAEAARNLFAALRSLDQSSADVIIAEYAPDAGLGKAINDRLRRASFDVA